MSLDVLFHYLIVALFDDVSNMDIDDEYFYHEHMDTSSDDDYDDDDVGKLIFSRFFYVWLRRRMHRPAANVPLGGGCRSILKGLSVMI